MIVNDVKVKDQTDDKNTQKTDVKPPEMVDKKVVTDKEDEIEKKNV